MHVFVMRCAVNTEVDKATIYLNNFTYLSNWNINIYNALVHRPPTPLMSKREKMWGPGAYKTSSSQFSRTEMCLSILYTWKSFLSSIAISDGKADKKFIISMLGIRRSRALGWRVLKVQKKRRTISHIAHKCS